MAKNNTAQNSSNFSSSDASAKDARDETVFTTSDTIPAGELRDIDLNDDGAVGGVGSLNSTSAFGSTGTGTGGAFSTADSDIINSTASEPIMDTVRGGGAPIPPSQFGETDTVPATFTAGATADSGTDLKQKAAQAVDTAKDAASNALDSAKQKAGEVYGQAKEQVADKVKTQLTDQMDRAASGLDHLTSALRQTGDVMEQNGLPAPVADYTQSFAGQVDKFSSYLRDKDVDDLVRDVETYARQNPMVFVGGSFLLGLAVARFLKSSESRAAEIRARSIAAAAPPNNFRTAPRSAGALVPVEGTRRGDLMSRTEEGTSRFSEDALPDNPPLTAHGYVPGIGVTDNGGGSSASGGSGSFGNTGSFGSTGSENTGAI